MRRLASLIAPLAAALLLAACGMAGDRQAANATDPAAPPVFHASGSPETLAEWNLIYLVDGELRLGEGVMPYDLNTALFTDYAHKLRTVWVPGGKAARFDAEETFDFPVGTIISKTFYYPRAGDAGQVERSEDDTEERLAAGFELDEVMLVETRLLVRRAEGWVALPYVWNEAQTGAVLKRTGAIQPLTLVATDGAETAFDYVVPNANQCQGCHATNATTKEIHPIGPKARHLNKDFAYRGGAQNQLAHWQQAGILTGVLADEGEIQRAALWRDASLSLEDRARSYIDINCAHCHNRDGPADTSGLYLEHGTPTGAATGNCKLPIAAGKGTGNRKYGIVPGHPDDSIMLYRMESTDPSVMMPELGRALSHEEGVKLVREWIAAMPGGCR